MVGRIIGTVAAVMLLAQGVWAATYMGAPTTNMRAGEWAVGVEASWSDQDVERVRPRRPDDTIGDYRIETVLARVSAGLATDRMEVFGRIGNVRVDWGRTESDNEPAYGAGMRVTTNLDDPVSWGFVLQGLYWQFDKDDNNIEGQAAMGPCWRQDEWILYGGPMAHFYHADGNGGLLGGAELDQESWFGGYLGGGVEVEHLSFTAEFQATADAWCAGGNLVWRF